MLALTYSFITSIYFATGISALVCIDGFWVLFKNRRTLTSSVAMLLASRSTLAGMYFCSYVWFLFHRSSQLSWSKVLFGVGPITWILVWEIPNRVIAHNQKRPELRGD